MGHNSQDPHIGFTPDPKPNPRINNPFPINELRCAKSVEIVSFCKNTYFRFNEPHCIENNGECHAKTQGNPSPGPRNAPHRSASIRSPDAHLKKKEWAPTPPVSAPRRRK